MAPLAYYYFISIALVITTSIYIFNLFYIRTKGKTTYGMTFKINTPEYKRVSKLASLRNITLFSILDIVFILSLADSMIKVLHYKTQDARFLLIFAPIAILIIIVMTIARNKRTNNPLQK